MKVTIYSKDRKALCIVRETFNMYANPKVNLPADSNRPDYEGMYAISFLDNNDPTKLDEYYLITEKGKIIKHKKVIQDRVRKITEKKLNGLSVFKDCLDKDHLEREHIKTCYYSAWIICDYNTDIAIDVFENHGLHAQAFLENKKFWLKLIKKTEVKLKSLLK